MICRAKYISSNTIITLMLRKNKPVFTFRRCGTHVMCFVGLKGAISGFHFDDIQCTKGEDKTCFCYL